MAQSVCPYCAVGCGQRVYVKDEKVTQIEGDPDSPISRGRLCPKSAASEPDDSRRCAPVAHPQKSPKFSRSGGADARASYSAARMNASSCSL
jgi:Molybdopterin oxidoreductase Fe4S4 domain